MRTGMVVLGLALGVLGVVGLPFGATNGLVWLDFVAAIVSLGSELVPERLPQALRATPYALAGVLLVFFVIGMAVDATRWLTWWTLAFAVGYVLLGASGNSTVPLSARRGGPTGVSRAWASPGRPARRGAAARRGSVEAMREVHFFYDIVCPFAYLGSTAIGGICHAAGARLRLRPMLLGGVYRAIGQADYPRVPAPRVRGNAIDLDRWARQRGVTLRFPFGHPRRTVETMRLLTACAMDCEGGDEAPLLALTQALYRAYWVDGDDLADRAVLARHAQAHGLSIDRIDDEAVKQGLRRTTDEAVAEGAFGAPTVVIVDERGERRMYFGQDRLHFVAEALGLPRAAPPPPRVPPAGRELVFLFDFASPYTYLAATQVERVARERGARVTWQPVFIGGLFKQIGNPIVPILETTEARRRYLGRDLLDWAGYWGVPFRWPSRFPLSTLTALRVTLAAEAAAVPRLALALFTAAWADDRDLGDPAVLREVADDAGCDGAALLARAGEADVKARLGEHTAAAVAAGAWGLPSFLVGDELFFGQDRLEQVAAALSA